MSDHKLHLYAALVFGVPLIVSAISGCILAFGEQIDHLAHPVSYVAVGSRELSLSAVETAVGRTYPDQRVIAMQLPQQNDGTIAVRLEDRLITFNRCTGAILATREDIPRQAAFLQYVSRIHRTLTMGRPGSVLVIVSSVALLALSISGVILWLPLRRSFTAHNTVGILSSGLQLMVAVTALFIALGRPIVFLAARVSGPLPDFRVPPSLPASGVKRVSADRVLKTAQEAIPDMVPLRIAFPRNDEGAFAVQMALEGSAGVGGQVSVDQYTGRPLAIVNPSSLRRMLRFARAMDDYHTGRLFGLPTQILAALAAAAIVHQAGSGYALWIGRANRVKQALTKHEGT